MMLSYLAAMCSRYKSFTCDTVYLHYQHQSFSNALLESLTLPGPIIRIAPNELHINDPSFLDTIYPTNHNHVRDKDWYQTRGLDVGDSTSGTISHELHRRRREALSPLFTQKNIASLEPLIKEKVAQLCAHLDAAIVSGNPVNLSDLYYAFARE